VASIGCALADLDWAHTFPLESNPAHEDPDDRLMALAVADQARRRLTSGLRLPAGLYLALGAAVAVQLGTAAYGIAARQLPGWLSCWPGWRFSWAWQRSCCTGSAGPTESGSTVSPARSSSRLGPPPRSSTLARSPPGIWAAFDSLWWLVAVAAVAGGTGCALGARHWWHAYRHDPAGHARGASPRALGGFAALACLGFPALLFFG
jgi:hypothetical protein